jgi:hypothetical protein
MQGTSAAAYLFILAPRPMVINPLSVWRRAPLHPVLIREPVRGRDSSKACERVQRRKGESVRWSFVPAAASRRGRALRPPPFPLSAAAYPPSASSLSQLQPSSPAQCSSSLDLSIRADRQPAPARAPVMSGWKLGKSASPLPERGDRAARQSHARTLPLVALALTAIAALPGAIDSRD